MYLDISLNLTTRLQLIQWRFYFQFYLKGYETTGSFEIQLNKGQYQKQKITLIIL